jgi:hypothetical protein
MKKKGNMTPLKYHNFSITDTERIETPDKEFNTLALKMINKL